MYIIGLVITLFIRENVMYHDNYDVDLKTPKTNSIVVEQQDKKDTNFNYEKLIFNEKEVYVDKFKELFSKTTKWSDNTQNLVIELLEIAEVFEESFVKKADTDVKELLKNVNLTEQEYIDEYYLNYLQYALQNTFFNRNVNGEKVERWQTKPQKFYTKKNKEKIKKILSAMSEFVDEVKIDKDKNYDYYVVLGAVSYIMRARLDFVLKNIKKDKQQKIIILTSNRQVFLKDETNENNKKLMDLIENAKSLEEIKNTKLKLTKEQKEVLNYYIKNKFSLERFRKDWKNDVLTEEGIGQMIVEEKVKNCKTSESVVVTTLETIKNGKNRANTIDTIRTLIDYLGSDNLENVIFITAQPSCPSQYSQIKTNFGDINIAAKKVNLDDEVAKILIQNIAESFNNYYVKLTKMRK